MNFSGEEKRQRAHNCESMCITLLKMERKRHSRSNVRACNCSCRPQSLSCMVGPCCDLPLLAAVHSCLLSSLACSYILPSAATGPEAAPRLYLQFAFARSCTLPSSRLAVVTMTLLALKRATWPQLGLQPAASLIMVARNKWAAAVEK